MVSNHPNYGRGPSQPQIWQTDQKAPTHKPTPRFQPLNSGSNMDFDRPWGGDAEQSMPGLDRAYNFAQRNLGNYLLYRAAVHGGMEQVQDEIEQDNAKAIQGDMHGPTRDDLSNIHKQGLSNPQPALGPAPTPRPHGPGPRTDKPGPMGAQAKGSASVPDARTQHGGRGPGQPPIPRPMGLDQSWNSRQRRTGMNAKNKPLDRDDNNNDDDTTPWFFR